MFDELDKYKSTDHFFYSKNDELKSVCNAPMELVSLLYMY